MWEYIEADFRRDYGIILARELPDMSWREFETLLAGLSPWGAVATHYDEALKKQNQNAPKSGEQQRYAADQFWQSVARI